MVEPANAKYNCKNFKPIIIIMTAKKKPKTKILVLSAHEDDLHANRVLKAGAKGYLTKRSAPSELVKAITKVVSGETFLEMEIAKSIALKQVTGEKEPIESLSSKEFEIFLELARSNKIMLS